MRFASARNALRGVAGATALGAAGYLAAMKAGKLELRPERFAAVALLLCVPLVGLIITAVAAAVRGPRRVSASAEAVASTGLLLALGFGLANWSLGLQGFAILFEREPVRLDRVGGSVSMFAGPLASRSDLALTVALGRLRLLPAGSEGFTVESRLRVLDASGEEVGLEVARGRPARHRNLVFRQGVFGFAPELVVWSGERVVHRARVPFRTIREGQDGIAFLGELDLQREGLKLRGAVTLRDLNDDMKGHPRLEIAVEHDGKPVGKGELAPGERAEMADGYAVGFAGLRRWSEIDVSSRSYSGPMLAGFALAVLGALTWATAAWRRW